MPRLARLTALALAAACMAMAPMPRPTVSPDIAPGQSAPFVGDWEISLPTRDATEPDVKLAICDLPVRIEAADEAHIVYLGPRQATEDAAIALTASGDGTDWQPIAGGTAYFSLWLSRDQFYLYDAVADGDPDWTAPYVYSRCD